MNDLLILSVIWLVSYLGHLAFYFTQGYIETLINHRFPEKRIQPRQKQRSDKRIPAEIRYSVKSLIITSGCLAGGLWLQWKGWTLYPPLELNWMNGLGMLIILMILYDAWFYWMHRLMHTKHLYRFHSLHHQSIAPTVWSNYSDSHTDAFGMQAFYIIVAILLPVPSVILVIHRIVDHINGQIGHSGFEFFADKLSRFPSPMLCVTFHDQHHQYFNYNFANYFSVWDRLFGTIHPQYDKTVESYEKSKNVISGKA